MKKVNIQLQKDGLPLPLPYIRNHFNFHYSIMERSVFEQVLLELYFAVLEHAGKGSCNVKIVISPLDQKVVDPDEAELRKRIIEALKSEKVIEEYALSKDAESILTVSFNYSNSRMWMGKFIIVAALIADCRIETEKFMNYADGVFNAIITDSENLAKLYSKLIDIVEIYFTEPVTRDQKLNNFYTELFNTLNGKFPPDLKAEEWCPFTSLFTAELEMEQRGLNLKQAISRMVSLLGKMRATIAFYDTHAHLEYSAEHRSGGMDDYLISLKSQKLGQNKSEPKLYLKNIDISYEDDSAILIIEGKKCQMPPYKNEHYFCRAMYEHKKGEVVDWSILWEKMTGYDATLITPEAKKENWRTVYDTVNALNKRIKECLKTDDDLFIWKEKTIRRNY